MSRPIFISFRPTELTVYSGYKFGYSLDATMNPGLAVDVVVLDSVKEPRQAPERVGLDSI
jgi:hypothetical protein